MTIAMNNVLRSRVGVGRRGEESYNCWGIPIITKYGSKFTMLVTISIPQKKEEEKRYKYIQLGI